MTQGDHNGLQPNRRRPDTATALRALIQDIRSTLPFGLNEAELCTGDCRGCSRKLLEFLELELTSWEQRLDAGERPGLKDLSQLLKTARKIERVLIDNGLPVGGRVQNIPGSPRASEVE